MIIRRHTPRDLFAGWHGSDLLLLPMEITWSALYHMERRPEENTLEPPGARGGPVEPLGSQIRVPICSNLLQTPLKRLLSLPRIATRRLLPAKTRRVSMRWHVLACPDGLESPLGRF